MKYQWLFVHWQFLKPMNEWQSLQASLVSETTGSVLAELEEEMSAIKSEHEYLTHISYLIRSITEAIVAQDSKPVRPSERATNVRTSRAVSFPQAREEVNDCQILDDWDSLNHDRSTSMDSLTGSSTLPNMENREHKASEVPLCSRSPLDLTFNNKCLLCMKGFIAQYDMQMHGIRSKEPDSPIVSSQGTSLLLESLHFASIWHIFSLVRRKILRSQNVI